MYTLTITKWEPIAEEEKREMDREMRSFNGGRGSMYDPHLPYGMREVRVLSVQLTPEEWANVKKATIESVG